MRLSVLLSVLFISSSIESVYAQNAYFKMGRQAFVDGDFKAAVAQLERSCVIDSTNSNAQWMLGYSYYHNENYKKSIQAYNRAIALKPADATAYYWRARAKGFAAKEPLSTPADKEKYLLGAIIDYTKSLEIEADNRVYQNRGIAYREYGMFKLQPDSKFYDKARGINSLKASVADLEKVLADDPTRTDIASLVDASKEKLASAQGIAATGKH